MSLLHPFFLFSLLFLAFSFSSAQYDLAPCPLDFEPLLNVTTFDVNASTQCQYVIQGLRLVLATYLQSTGSFLPPINSSESCWDSYQSVVNNFTSNFNIRSDCGFETTWISEGCMNITTRSQFDAVVSQATRADIVASCNQSLENSSPCATCTTSLSNLQAVYLTGSSVGNLTDCTAYPSIYAAGFANYLGPTDPGTAKCLFNLNFASGGSGNKRRGVVIVVVVVVCSVVFLAVIGGSISGSTTLIKFTIDEIRQATRNFTRDNIIGRGGYGNVYKGVLKDGSEVAFKVALRGYCTATTPLEGHQRIIVCDLMKNGSLHDHLFGSTEKLSWPLRQKIALGTARGLAYLHSGAQPGIIHRDIKASNILLDEKDNGYVAPEYALYGQLTERSDVYSFGVVLLELLSGKKALMVIGENQPSLVTDWAWSLVRKGRAIDVVDNSMPELGSPEVMEKYVLVAVLCSHPQLYARPAMDQVVKILETDLPVPSIPERPISIVAEMDDIERSVSSSDMGCISSSAGYQSFTFEGQQHSD
ncbi:putative LRR receptor-like serine/threonine-protein kinase RKF3 [Vitis vinifera]|uniref:Putative LRR receptor-like serine/threonine-protein kinase RKF3 n=1 Tax=Vitis vinifera TaxID=29760 RepID=A0A438F4D3_VITVI|nr:putative LRR receptor-like serine/threonine-protein kinase RKF3 [Vitis vinifera]